MCGLFALVRRGDVDPDRGGRALDLLAHRGPDGSSMQTFLLKPRSGRDEPPVHAVLGHTRLAIQDLDARSNQPFQRGSRTIVYNGEVYNFKALAADLKRRGHSFETTGDTEVLLTLLESDGRSGLDAVNGMWAYVLLDRERRRLVAARDRWGKKPLFYMQTRDGFAFASHIKALLALTGDVAETRPGAIDRFIAHGWCFPAPDGTTHLARIREVRPGHALSIDLDTWTMSERRVSTVANAASDEPMDEEALASTLADAVELRLVSDRRVGLLLSGGVDSSLVLSILAARGLASHVTCITGDAGKSEDAAYARAALDQLGMAPLMVALDYGTTGFDDFLDVCRHQEKPFPLIGNVLGLPPLYRAMAAEGIRVAIDGTGADEIFGGYWKRQVGFAMRDAACAADASWLERVRRAGAVTPDLAHLDLAQLRRAHIPEPNAETLGPRDMAYLTDETKRALAAADCLDPLVGFTGSLAEALVRDATEGRLQEWLWQNDRSAMAFGVENRSPFLDFRLARWMSTGYAAKFDGAWNKRELRALFARFTPLATASRREKQGFRWVYGRFLRQNRRRVIELIASSAHARRCLDGDRLLDEAARDDSVLELDLVQRLAVVAGLEAVGMLATS